jgi:hypothetical protein
MRNTVARVVLATVIGVGASGVTAAPARAAVRTSCTAVNGSGSFKPGLPKVGVETKVKSTFRVPGAAVGDCKGGGVARGTLSFTLKAGVAGNCATLRKFTDMKFAGTAKIVWNTKAISRIAAAKMTPVPHSQMIRMKLTGKVTSGKFTGAKLTSEFNISGTGTSGCLKQGLSKVTIRRAHPLTIE